MADTNSFSCVLEDGVAKEVECGVCLHPWCDPIELLPCKHIFCKTCVGDGRRCHMCREAIVTRTEPNRILVNMAAEVRVRCDRCAAEMPNRERLRHRCDPAAVARAAAARAAGPAQPRPVPAAPAGSFAPQPQRPAVAPPSGPAAYSSGVAAQQPTSAAAPVGQAQAYTPSPAPPPVQFMHAAIPRGASSSQPRAATRGIWDQYGLTQEEYDHIFAVFMTFDMDDSGELDRDELTTLCRYLNFATDPTDIDRMFREMDTDNSGRLNMDEFCRWLGTHRPDPRALYGLSAEQYHEVLFQFHTYDRDNSGTLDEHEFTQLSMRMGYARTAPDALRLFHQIDTDRSGKVDLHELLIFRARYQGGGGAQQQQQRPPPPPPQHQQAPQAFYAPQQQPQQYPAAAAAAYAPQQQQQQHYASYHQAAAAPQPQQQQQYSYPPATPYPMTTLTSSSHNQGGVTHHQQQQQQYPPQQQYSYTTYQQQPPQQQQQQQPNPQMAAAYQQATLSAQSVHPTPTERLLQQQQDYARSRGGSMKNGTYQGQDSDACVLQ